jgi:hypothetical protein
VRDLRLRCSLQVLVVILGVLAGCSALQAYSRSAQDNDHRTSLVATRPALYFGSVIVGNSMQAEEWISNPTDADVTITSAASSTGEFQVISPIFPTIVHRGRGIRLTVRFTPNAPGNSSAAIVISSNASQPSITVSASAKAIASGSLVLSSPSLSFGNVAVGNNLAKPDTFTNSGDTSITISKVTTNSGNFSVTGLALPITLKPNQRVNFNVVFKPSATGTQSGSIAANATVSLVPSPSSFQASARDTQTAQATSQNEIATLQVSGTGTQVTGSNPNTPGVLSFSSNPVAFGTVTVGSSQNASATVTNSGGSSITLTRATVTGAGFSMSSMGMPMTLAPKQSANVKITCAPQTAGALNGSLSIASNASNTNLAVPLTAMAVTAGGISASVPSLSFGKVTVGSSQILPETLTNSGGTSITLTQAAAGAGYSVTGLSLPLTLNGGQSTSFSVAFAPQSAGSSTVNLAITDNGSTPTFSIPLSGTGVTSGTLVANSVSFGSVQVGSSRTQTATLTNSGGASVTVSQANLTGTGFTMTGISLPLILSVGQAFTFSVTFAPQSAGSNTGRITLASNASGATPSISLSGSGTAAGQFSISPGSFSFGSLVVGANKSLPATLTAAGSSVTVTSASLSSSEFALSGPSLPLTIPAGGTAAFTLTFTPQASGAASATVSFATNAPGSPVTESLSGSGTAAPSHAVNLSWSENSSGVAGYNIYRSGTTGGPYAKLDASTDTSTSYTDSSVEAGQTYYYVTTSVGADGMESAYSSQISAVIPTP